MKRETAAAGVARAILRKANLPACGQGDINYVPPADDAPPASVEPQVSVFQSFSAAARPQRVSPCECYALVLMRKAHPQTRNTNDSMHSGFTPRLPEI